MPINKDQFELIATYLSGQATPEEQKLLEEWRVLSAENALAFREIELIWKHSNLKLEYPGTANSDWQALEQKLSEQKQLSFWSNNWIRIAASITIILVIAVWLFPKRDSMHELDIAQSYVASESVETIFLQDSSIVWLNKDSKLGVTTSFGNKTREVQLEGEAYFKVKSNKAVPFIIHTNQAITEVVGTSFNITETKSATRVEVAEGTVRVAGRKKNESVVLNRNEGSVIDNGQAAGKFKIDSGEIGKWRKSNNETYLHEKNNRTSFIATTFKWNKNTINQSVIKGTLKNKATLADYTNIVLVVSYRKPNGKSVKTTFKVMETLHAGATLDFEKRLLDLFTDTRDVEVQVQSAEIKE